MGKTSHKSVMSGLLLACVVGAIRASPGTGPGQAQVDRPVQDADDRRPSPHPHAARPPRARRASSCSRAAGSSTGRARPPVPRRSSSTGTASRRSSRPACTDWPKDARVIDVAGKTVMPGSHRRPHPHRVYRARDAAARGHRARPTGCSGPSSGPASISSAASPASGTSAPITTSPSGSRNGSAQNRVPPRASSRPALSSPRPAVTASRASRWTSACPTARGSRKAPTSGGRPSGSSSTRARTSSRSAVISAATRSRRRCEEAHALGLKVCADAETFYIQWAVEAGVDVIEHPLPRTDETIRLMAQKGTEAVPTLVPYAIIFDDWGGYYGSTSRRFTFSKEANLEVLKRMKKAGVKMGIGTDLVTNWFRRLPAPYIAELKYFVEAGLYDPRGPGRGDEDQRRDPGHGRQARDHRARQAGGCHRHRREARREPGRPGQGGYRHPGRLSRRPGRQRSSSRATSRSIRPRPARIRRSSNPSLRRRWPRSAGASRPSSRRPAEGRP